MTRSMLESIKATFSPPPAEGRLTAEKIDNILSRVEKSKSGNTNYESIELSRDNQSLTFKATVVLSPAQKEMLVDFFNKQMQYKGFTTNKGQMVLIFVKNRNIGHTARLQQGIDDAMAALSDPKKAIQAANSAESTGTENPLAKALKEGRIPEVAKIVDKQLEDKDKALRQALEQNNVPMIGILKAAGINQRSLAMTNAQGVSAQELLDRQAGEQDRIQASLVEQNKRAQEQVNDLKKDISAWMSGVNFAQSDTLVTPVLQRSPGVTPAMG